MLKKLCEQIFCISRNYPCKFLSSNFRDFEGNRFENKSSSHMGHRAKLIAFSLVFHKISKTTVYNIKYKI